MGQRELLADALRLATENPDAEIHVCAESDELLGDEYAWTIHHISKVELGWWYVDDGTDLIFNDPGELVEHYAGWYEEDITEEQAHSIMKPAILIYTRA